MDISIFMFKVGEYYESEIKAVSSYLKDAGFKVEIKGLVTARMDHTATRQGRLSELKERLAGFSPGSELNQPGRADKRTA